MDPQPPPPPPPQQPPQQPPLCWSQIVKQPPTEPQPPPTQPPLQTKLIDPSKQPPSKGRIAVAVVDANAIIQGGDKLSTFADKFVSVNEVISEIRDPTSRHRLSFLPFVVDTLEPSPESLNKVISFARATGDLQTLSDVDLKLIALTYTLEAQIHGTTHLRDSPPPIHVLNVRRLPEKDLPGWGSNVPNLEEWEALDAAADGGPQPTSRILPLKDLTLNIPVEDRLSSQDGSVGDHDGVEVAPRRHRRFPPKKREVKIEGKKMVADGIDASQGQCDDDDGGDWRPAVSRSTHRRFLKRQARREMYEASLKDEEQQDVDKNTEGEIKVEAEHNDQISNGLVDQELSEENKGFNGTNGAEDVSSILEQMRLEEDALKSREEQNEQTDSISEVPSIDANLDNGEDDDDDIADHLENGSVDTSFAEEDGSEMSWMLRSLSESSVACITADFAMQNVILQMGLRLIAPGGMQIRELNRWVLKCHACLNVTAEVGRVFCPKCGNGGTLRKVAVTVGENGVVLKARRHRNFLRGTKFSLPLPQGGRDAITKNPVLREDQLPQKFLYPKTKKKSNKEDDFFGADSIFSHHSDKKAPLRPPVRQALAVFSGKRNPNDNHYSRAKH